MLTRKSELGSPLGAEASPPVLRGKPSASDAGSSRTDTFLAANGVRPQVKQLFKDLRKLQGTRAHAVWPNQKENNALYQKLYRLRSDYKKSCLW